MADDTASTTEPKPREPGAPIARDEIDPELVNLRKARPKIGAITAAGVAILCAYLVVRLVPDLVFSRQGDKPTPTSIDKLSDNAFVEIPLSIERARAVRLRQNQGGAGMRAAPVAGTTNAVWVVMTGDGWAPAVPNAAFSGRVRDLDDVPFGAVLRDHVAAHPGPSFATLAAARAAFATGLLTTVGGDKVHVAPGDPVEIDVPVPDAAVLILRFSDRLPGPAAWLKVLEPAGIVGTTPMHDITDYRARLDVGGPDAVTTVTAKLQAAKLWAEVAPVSKTVKTTWGELAKAGPAPGSITVGGEQIADARIDLIRVIAKQPVPEIARVIVVGEVPEDYWYVLPLAIALTLLGAMAAWALIRAIKRDYLTAKVATPAET